MGSSETGCFHSTVALPVCLSIRCTLPMCHDNLPPSEKTIATSDCRQSDSSAARQACVPWLPRRFGPRNATQCAPQWLWRTYENVRLEIASSRTFVSNSARVAKKKPTRTQKRPRKKKGLRSLGTSKVPWAFAAPLRDPGGLIFPLSLERPSTCPCSAFIVLTVGPAGTQHAPAHASTKPALG